MCDTPLFISISFASLVVAALSLDKLSKKELKAVTPPPVLPSPEGLHFSFNFGFEALVLSVDPGDRSWATPLVEGNRCG